MRCLPSQRSMLHSIVIFGVIILALGAGITGTGQASAHVARGGSGATFNFLPVYAGKNSGDAIGAVGSNAGLEVSSITSAYGWPTGSNVDVSIVALQSENSDGTCGGAAYTSLGTYPIAAISSGSFTATFIWPAAATKSAGPVYAACLKPTGTAGGWKTSAKAGDVGNPGTFTVTTDAPAMLALTPTELHRGETLTVTGKNWLPIYNSAGIDTHVSVTIGKCNSGVSLGGTPPTVGGDGSFSATFIIPDTADLTTYEACAFTNGGAQAVDHNPGSSQTPPTFQVLETAPTATAVPPTATAIPPTPTVAATSTTVAAGTGGTTTGSGGSSSNNNGTIAVILGLVALILLGAGLLLFFLQQRPKSPPPTSGPMQPNRSPGQFPNGADQSWVGTGDTPSGEPTVWQNPVNPPTKPGDTTDPFIWG